MTQLSVTVTIDAPEGAADVDLEYHLDRFFDAVRDAVLVSPTIGVNYQGHLVGFSGADMHGAAPRIAQARRIP